MTRRMALTVMLAVIAYGISDELHQRFTPVGAAELLV
ncbi:MAG: VanZ family protein [Anaerolineae bacterium]